jgi:hypothetical protein
MTQVFNFKFIVIEQKDAQLRVNDHVETVHKAAYEAKRQETERILGKGDDYGVRINPENYGFVES